MCCGMKGDYSTNTEQNNDIDVPFSCRVQLCVYGIGVERFRRKKIKHKPIQTVKDQDIKNLVYCIKIFESNPTSHLCSDIGMSCSKH